MGLGGVALMRFYFIIKTYLKMSGNFSAEQQLLFQYYFQHHFQNPCKGIQTYGIHVYFLTLTLDLHIGSYVDKDIHQALNLTQFFYIHSSNPLRL